MSPYRHILCPVDFSDVSKNALGWALQLAERFDASVTLLHVIDTTGLTTESLSAAPLSVQELRVRTEENLHALGQEMRLTGVSGVTVEGAPAEAIAEEAAARGADLLVMGTHGWSGAQRLLLGSVTEKVLHRVEVPLLAVTAEARGTADFATILVALDLGDDAKAAVRHAVWLAEKHGPGARLIAVHIVPVPYVVLNDRTLERLSPPELAELEQQLTEERRERVAELLPDGMAEGVQAEIVTRVGNVFDSLREVVADVEPDLVVMGAGGHGHSALRWLGSTCHKMVRLGACPVLIAR